MLVRKSEHPAGGHHLEGNFAPVWGWNRTNPAILSGSDETCLTKVKP
jgi:hypothetical protein